MTVDEIQLVKEIAAGLSNPVQAQQVRAILDDRDDWKRRALIAERAVAELTKKKEQ